MGSVRRRRIAARKSPTDHALHTIAVAKSQVLGTASGFAARKMEQDLEDGKFKEVMSDKDLKIEEDLVDDIGR
jgi:hypothetical protein